MKKGNELHMRFYRDETYKFQCNVCFQWKLRHEFTKELRYGGKEYQTIKNPPFNNSLIH